MGRGIRTSGATHKINNRGQMAVFVALLFQVLFVFFAMVINVGLLVHDKINLQNSVDIAAIYGAQRQAEILNAIAHNNYQMRQSWKLLAWRLRVLGDSGRIGHPVSNPANFSTDDVADPGLNDATPPTVCVIHALWSEFSMGSGAAVQNVCKTNQPVHQLSLIQNLAPFLPWSQAVNAYSRNMQLQFNKSCEEQGQYNWYFAAKWLASYKFDIRNRKKAIRELANLLTAHGPSDLQEISGGQMAEGLNKTLSANLTKANRANLGTVQIYNSMGGIDSTAWLPDIPVVPIVYYTHTQRNLRSGDCERQASPINLDFGGVLQVPNTLNLDPDGMLAAETREPLQGTDEAHSSLGVEKNPWYMAYVGVHAITQPRHPFAPFGKGVVLEARAFAQPFGGRIGPWYASQWQPEAETSSGNKIDSLLPSRFENSLLGDPDSSVPNYSRYPGDKIGLKSKLSLGSLRSIAPGTINVVSKFDYAWLPADFLTKDSEALAWNFNNQDPPAVRPMELEGIAPDLFDITYYSIEPNYVGNYLQQLQNLGSAVLFRHDLGYHGSSQDQGFSVRDQMSQTAALPGVQSLGYLVHNSDSGNAPLLTSWTQSKPVEYERSPSGFAYCNTLSKVAMAQVANRGISAPGDCLIGGRTGYSVKIVSKNYLNSQALELGGDGVTGPLKNAPGDF